MRRQAGVYLRISSDPTGARLGVARQRTDCEAKAKARDWDVVEVFEDNDTSASTGKRRPAYERMLDAIRAGRITAVVVWDLDRLTRRPIEIEQFIELADRHKLELASVGGDIDLSTDNGRLYARIKGAVARAEVERKSARQLAANRQRRAAGRLHPGGRRLFGYEADGRQAHPVEAAAVQRAAAALLTGCSMHEIARAWNRDGLSTTAGNPWKPTEARRLLANPRLAGLLTYQGETIGDGDWPPILDADTHRAVLGVLADPARHKAGRPRSYLLSGTATCGVCGQVLFGGFEQRKQYSVYRCPSRAHICRRIDQIDELVTDLLLTRLAAPDALDLFTPPQDRSDARGLQDEERSVRARLTGLAEAFAAGEIDRQQLRAGSERLNARLGELGRAINAIVQQPDLTGLLGAQDIAAAWAGMGIERQRRTVRALLAAVRVHPAGQGARVFDPASVSIEWR